MHKFDLNEIMTIPEAAERYGVNIQTLKNYFKPSIVGQDIIDSRIAANLIRQSAKTWLLTPEFMEIHFQVKKEDGKMRKELTWDNVEEFDLHTWVKGNDEMSLKEEFEKLGFVAEQDENGVVTVDTPTNTWLFTVDNGKYYTYTNYSAAVENNQFFHHEADTLKDLVARLF